MRFHPTLKLLPIELPLALSGSESRALDILVSFSGTLMLKWLRFAMSFSLA